jgi:hypothetical protein
VNLKKGLEEHYQILMELAPKCQKLDFCIKMRRLLSPCNQYQSKYRADGSSITGADIGMIYIK